MRAVSMFALLVLAGAHLEAQKVDSLLLHLHLSRDRAADATVAAFTRSGLDVTNTTSSIIEADQGITTNALTGGETERIVRAILFGSDSVTTVLIVGEEVRKNQAGHQIKRLRIDNRANGNGEKVWKKMIAAAMILDSAEVPAAAIRE